jgi:hypothetical protein
MNTFPRAVHESQVLEDRLNDFYIRRILSKNDVDRARLAEQITELERQRFQLSNPPSAGGQTILAH